MQNQFLLFEGLDANGTSGLWVTDGTAAGTHELTNISGANPAGLSPRYLTVFNSEVLFDGFNANGALGLWVTDGTSTGTHELTGISGANSTGLFSNVVNPNFTSFDGQVLFSGVNASGATGLWVTDGTPAGTHELTISGAPPAGVDPYAMAVLGTNVLFAGSDVSGSRVLWVTDGTGPGTHELTGISGAYQEGLGLLPSHLTTFNDHVLFEGKDASGKLNLWLTDGTAAGTHEVTGIGGANSGGLFSNAGNPDPDFTIFNDKVLFNGLNTNGDFGLWVTDGSAAGTHEITGITGTNGLSPRDMTVIDNKVVFIGGDANGQFDLWVTDGSAAGTHQLTSTGLWPTVNGAKFATFNGQVFFNATRDFGLWVTDGTSTGTHELTGIPAAFPGFLDPQYLTTFTSSASSIDPISPYIFANTVFDQTSDAAPLAPWFYFFSIGATFLTAGDYSAASAGYPGPGSPQTLALIAPTNFDFGSPAFTSLSSLQAAYPFGIYTVTGTGNQSSTSSVSYQANYFTNTVPFITNYSSLNGFNPTNDFTVHYNSFTPDPHVTTGYTFLTIWNANTHQVVFQDNFESPSSTSDLIPANTLSPNTNYTFELDFSDRLIAGSGTQGFDMRTDGSFTTGSIFTNQPPVIDLAHSTIGGTINERPNLTGSLALDIANGAIAFTDADLNDRPTASVTHQTVSWQDAQGHVSQLTDAQVFAFENAFSIVPEVGNTDSGKIDWSFTAQDSAFDFISVGETVVVTSTVDIDDGHGGKVDQDVTVTINGADDAPIASPDIVVTQTGAPPVITDAAHGVLANDHDLDSHDRLHVSAVNFGNKTVAVSSGSPATVVGAHGTLVLHSDGSYEYTALSSATKSGQDLFTYTVDDANGGTATSGLVVTVQPSQPVNNPSVGLQKAAQIFSSYGTDGEIVVLATLAEASYHLLPSPLEFQGASINVPDPLADALYNFLPTGLRVLTPADLPSLTPTYDSTSAFPFHNNFPTTGLIDGIFVDGNAAAFITRSSDSLFIAFRGTNDLGHVFGPADFLKGAADLSSPDVNDWFRMDDYYNLLRPLTDALNTYVNDASHGVSHIYVTGHSLGASMAERFVTDHAGDTRFQAVTFANPGYTSPVAGRVDDPRIINLHVDHDPALDLAVPITQLRGDDYIITGVENAGAGSLHEMSLYYAAAQFLNQNYDLPIQALATNGHPDTVHVFGNVTWQATVPEWKVTLPSGTPANPVLGTSGIDYMKTTPGSTMTGGGQGDTFVFGPAFGRDTIQDFQPGHDVIQLDQSLFGNVKAIMANTHDDGLGNTVVTYDATDTIMLQGVTKAQLQLTDFHIV